jgi:pyruvate dehydrogenase E2 component (dihydrolipoamide acetyltransferase)
MAQIVGLPKLSPTMEEGVLVKWVKKEGDKVAPGDLIAEVETDKANMDFNIEDAGVLLKFLVKEGDTVKLGAPVMIMGKAGEDIAALLLQATSAPTIAAAAVAVVATAPAAVQGPPPPVATSTATIAKPAAVANVQTAPRTGQVLASPLAKSLAIELGIDLRTLTGSGPGGRIVERDVRGAAAGNGDSASPVELLQPGSTLPHSAPPAPNAAAAATALVVQSSSVPVAAPGDHTDVPASNMRKRIAVRLTEAKRDVPHFYLQRSIDAAPLLVFRQRLNDLLGDRGKISVNDLVIKAVALALRRVPQCNASWQGDAIRHYHRVHIGIAVAVEDGLVTPVVRDADLKGLGAIAVEIRDLATRAKTRALKSHEISGSTFTVSNLGMFGIERFTAILNPPEAGILAVGAVLDAPVIKDGAVIAGKRMTVSMSCDHRVIDGALGSQWLIAFADLLEHPESLAL